jgi:hypothetical protein
MILPQIKLLLRSNRNSRYCRIQNLRFVLLALALVSFFCMLLFSKKETAPNISANKETGDRTNDKNKFLSYKKSCLELYAELKNPKPEDFHRPPLERPPDDLMNEFTQNGEMPIRRYYYRNDAYSDASANAPDKANQTIAKEMVDDYRRLNGTERRRKLKYKDSFLVDHMMRKYSSHLAGQTVAVIGTQEPWLEAIALDINSSKVFTLEYTRKEYEQKEILEWLHVQDYLGKSIREEKIEEFDNAASFSSIEHSGLGRYGDPLDPNGDIKAVKQVHCMIKPGGLFFLGLMTSWNNESYLEFNAHRVYGYKRLVKLFVGWDLLEQTPKTTLHSVFVLRKKLTKYF